MEMVDDDEGYLIPNEMILNVKNQSHDTRDDFESEKSH
jgi:hypothetical protein